jgi:hypothetical protein
MSSVLSEVTAWILLSFSLLGSTSRPLLAGLFAYVVRQLCLTLNPILPAPANAIWVNNLYQSTQHIIQ